MKNNIACFLLIAVFFGCFGVFWVGYIGKNPSGTAFCPEWQVGLRIGKKYYLVDCCFYIQLGRWV
jgi:hypothetical protein